jgi:hypothetical protein
MIRAFKHRGLKRLHERGDRSRLRQAKLEAIEDGAAFDVDLLDYHQEALE